jgi:hypothetical protein
MTWRLKWPLDMVSVDGDRSQTLPVGLESMMYSRKVELRLAGASRG